MPPQQPPRNVLVNGKIKLLFVGRISVRKGIDLLIDLTHRLDSLSDQIEIEVIGGPSFWSDYTGNLRKMNPRVATYVGPKTHDEIMRRFGEADLLLVPSQYEPGGIVVAEALSQGCCVIVSDEVGSAESLSDRACYRFCAGDIGAFERSCRLAIQDAQSSRAEMRAKAISEAKHAFSDEKAIERLMKALMAAASRGPLNTNRIEPVSA
jgi:glycosyltransferase involved in cell wall biosynthesis